MIGEAKKNLKTMEYQLRRLVCAKDEAQMTLSSQQMVEIVADQLMYFKISVRDRPGVPGGKLLINYTKGLQKQGTNQLEALAQQSAPDLRIFYSSNDKVREPNE